MSGLQWAGSVRYPSTSTRVAGGFVPSAISHFRERPDMGDPVEAALLAAIALLERNQAVPCTVLTVICEAEGENAELFRRRPMSAFKPASNRQRLTAILHLQEIVVRRSSLDVN